MKGSQEYIEGFERAERELMAAEPNWPDLPPFENPYPTGSDQHRGYEAAIRHFTDT